MSGFAIVPANILERKDLSAADKLVFVALASFADKERRCFPGTQSLVRRTGLSARSIFRSVKNLEQAGIISVERRFDPDRREYAVNRYSLQYDEIPQGTANLSGGTDRLAVGHDTVAVGHDRKYPRVVSQWHNNSTKEQNQEHHHEQADEVREVFTPRRDLLKNFLEKGTTQDPEIKDKGRGGYPDFDSRVREHFKVLCATFPKKTSTGMKIALALFRQFFSDDPEYQERNSDRLTNILSAATLYAEECRGRESKYVKSLASWIKGIDADVPTTIEVETLVRCPDDEMGGDAA